MFGLAGGIALSLSLSLSLSLGLLKLFILKLFLGKVVKENSQNYNFDNLPLE
jgi:hypothetical protein